MNRHAAPHDYDCFAITAPGLEPLCVAELRARGIAPSAQAVAGGVAWHGDARSLYRANLESRSASRVVARAGEFRARMFSELERRAAKLPWQRFLQPGAAVALRVTCRKSKLYHEGAVAERLEKILAGAVGARVEAVAGTDGIDDVVTEGAGVTAADAVADGAQLVIVRFLRDVCTISIDASGALLHLRGYRQAVAKAPLRETLAAALLLACDWPGARRDRALLDPMCGSGTLPIEAALLARHIAPGLARPGLTPRSYAFEEWPEFDDVVWSDVVAHARDVVRNDAGVVIAGSDRDAGAVAAARANAARAGVADDVQLTQATVTAVAPPAGRGLLLTNPPYGVRVGERQALGPLYAALGRLARERLPGWQVALLAADERLAAATGLPLRPLLATRNGGIAVRLLASPDLADTVMEVADRGPPHPAEPVTDADRDRPRPADPVTDADLGPPHLDNAAG